MASAKTSVLPGLSICMFVHLLGLCVCVCVTSVELMTSQVRQQRQQQQQLLLMNLHLLANPGDSLLLQHTLDRLLRWLCPSLRIFHVSERASPFRSYTRLCPVAGNDPYCVVLQSSYTGSQVCHWQGSKTLLCLYIPLHCTLYKCIFLCKQGK